MKGYNYLAIDVAQDIKDIGMNLKLIDDQIPGVQYPEANIPDSTHRSM